MKHTTKRVVVTRAASRSPEFVPSTSAHAKTLGDAGEAFTRASAAARETLDKLTASVNALTATRDAAVADQRRRIGEATDSATRSKKAAEAARESEIGVDGSLTRELNEVDEQYGKVKATIDSIPTSIGA